MCCLFADHESWKRGVRFSLVTETISDQDQFLLWQQEQLETLANVEQEEEEIDEGAEADTELDDSDSTIQFTSKAEGCDSLTIIRRNSIKAVEVGPQPTLKTLADILEKLQSELNQGRLSRSQMHKLVSVAKEVLADDMDVTLSSSQSSSLGSLNSLNIDTTQGGTVNTTVFSEYITKQVIDKVKEQLTPTPQQSGNENLFAKFIISQVIEKVRVQSLSHEIEVPKIEESTSTSTATTQTPQAQEDNLEALSSFIVEKALLLTADSILGLTDEVIEPKIHPDNSGKDKQIAKSVMSHDDTAVEETSAMVGVTDVTEGQTTMTSKVNATEIPQESIVLVKVVLSKVVDEMKTLQKNIDDLKSTEIKRIKNETLKQDSMAALESCNSSILALVDTTLHNVAREEEEEQLRNKHLAIRQTEAVGSSISAFVEKTLKSIKAEQETIRSKQSLLDRKPSSHDKVNALVNNTLETVVLELQQCKEPSETELLIQCVIKAASAAIAGDLDMQQTPAGNSSSPLKRKASADSTLAFIQDTLHHILKEIDDNEELLGIATARSSSSRFAEEIVKQTLIGCIKQVRSDELTNSELTKVAMAIISSHDVIALREPKFTSKLVRSLESVVNTPSPQPQTSAKQRQYSIVEAPFQPIDLVHCTNSNLVDVLIMDTLQKVYQSLKDGTMSVNDVERLADEIRLVSGQSLNKTTSSTDNVSNDAADMVQQVLSLVISNLQKSPMVSDSDAKSCSSIASADVYCMIDTVLAKVMAQMKKEKMEKAMAAKYEEENKQAERITDERPEQALESHTLQGETQEPDVALVPTLDGKPLDIDPQVIKESLIAISASNPISSTPHKATDRNSFFDLSHPDMSRVSTINTSSGSAKISDQLVALSSKSLALSQSQLSKVGVNLRKPSRAMSERISSVTYTKIAEQEDLTESESSGSDDADDRLLSVQNVMIPQPASTKKNNSKTRTDLKRSSQTTTQSTPKNSTAQLKAVYGTPTSSSISVKKKSSTNSNGKDSKVKIVNSTPKVEKSGSTKLATKNSSQMKSVSRDTSKVKASSTHSKSKMAAQALKVSDEDLKSSSMLKLEIGGVEVQTMRSTKSTIIDSAKDKIDVKIEELDNMGSKTKTVTSEKKSSVTLPPVVTGSKHSVKSKKESQNDVIEPAAENHDSKAEESDHSPSKSSSKSSTSFASNREEDLDQAETVEEEPQLKKKSTSSLKNLEMKHSTSSNKSGKNSKPSIPRLSQLATVHKVASKGSGSSTASHKAMNLTPRPSSPFCDSIVGSKKSLATHTRARLEEQALHSSSASSTYHNKLLKSSGSSVDVTTEPDTSLPHTKSVSDAVAVDPLSAAGSATVNAIKPTEVMSQVTLLAKKSLSHMSQLAGQQTPRSISPASTTASDVIPSASHASNNTDARVPEEPPKERLI